MNHRSFFVSLVFGAGVLAGCGSFEADPAGVSEDELGTTYGSLIDTLQDEERDAWLRASRKLRDGFERLQPSLGSVRLTCSTTRAQRKMKECVWVVAGNIDQVTARTFVCSIPVAGNAPAFLDALTKAGDDALLARLPGTNGSFLDGLIACFDPVVAPPPPELDAETQRKLAAAFDDACGNSFCEGDYGDITALRLACDVRRTDEHVDTCHWAFAMADGDVDSRGRIRTRTATKTCDIPIDAPASALKTVLAGNDALHAALPGKTTSLYDALVDCL